MTTVDGYPSATSSASGASHGPTCDAIMREDSEKMGVDPEKLGTDTVGKGWYWGHMDNEVEPPEGCPVWLDAATLPLKVMPHGSYFRDFARFASCPSWLDDRAKDYAEDGTTGCPFLGGTAFLRHKDVKTRLEQVVPEHLSAKIKRKNELGYFELNSDPFPDYGGLSLGGSVEQHRVQRQWLEFLLDKSRLPDRDGWLKEVLTFLKDRKQFKAKEDIAKWWQQMLWRHILQKELTWEEAEKFAKFQDQWLLNSVLALGVAAPGAVLDCLPEALQPDSGKVLATADICEIQDKYRKDVMDCLPAEVPEDSRKLVAQSVLEALVFAGGLSVPQTIHAAIAVLHTPELWPCNVEVTTENVEAFVYEVTRLFPAVQGFCYWRRAKGFFGQSNNNRELLSLNAALRDPAVWGRQESRRFSLKDVELYRNEHVGFAQQATSEAGTFDSKSCPGYHMSLDVVQAFVLAMVSWQENAHGKQGYWSALRKPQPAKVPHWWKSFTLEYHAWLDGDQTGEQLVADMTPLKLSRLERTVEEAPDAFVHLLGSFGIKKIDLKNQAKLMKMDTGTRIFYELAKVQYKDLSNNAKDAVLIEKTPPQQAEREYLVALKEDDESTWIRLPAQKGMGKKIAEQVFAVVHFLYGIALDDSVSSSLVVDSPESRAAAIVLCQAIFAREHKEKESWHSDSFLPKAPDPFPDIYTDCSQSDIARCGMGQLFLRRNTNPMWAEHGDIVCDASLLQDFTVRPDADFEDMGATAIFKRGVTDRGAGWELSAIDWCHRKNLPPGCHWVRLKRGQPIPPNAVKAGETKTDGPVWVGRCEGEAGKINANDSQKFMHNFWGNDVEDKTRAEILCCSVQHYWLPICRGEELPRNVVKAGETSVDGATYVGRFRGEAGKINVQDGKMFNFWGHYFDDSPHAEILVIGEEPSVGCRWFRISKGERIPDNAVKAGETSTDGEVWVGRVNGEAGKINNKNGHMKHFYGRDNGCQEFADILCCSLERHWHPIKSGQTIPANAVKAGETSRDGVTYVARNDQQEAGKINVEDGKMFNFWAHHSGRSSEAEILVVERPQHEEPANPRQLVLPGDAEWEHAKFVWRSSLFTQLTAVNHLMWNHWIIANALYTSCRECFDPHHPVRRLLTVFTYKTHSVNYRSLNLLYPERAVLHRMCSLTYESLHRVFEVAGERFRFTTWPELHENMDLPAEVKDKLPMFEDGLPLYKAFYDFCAGFVNVFYTSDEDVTSDESLCEYWKFRTTPQYTQGLPPLSKEGLSKQLAQGLFDVTAYHSLVGGVVEYTTDPAGAFFQVRSGRDMADMQQMIITNALVSGTGYPMPKLISMTDKEGDPDWIVLLDLTETETVRPEWASKEKYAEVQKLRAKLYDDFEIISDEIKARNESKERGHSFSRFDPKILDRSVSI